MEFKKINVRANNSTKFVVELSMIELFRLYPILEQATSKGSMIIFSEKQEDTVKELLDSMRPYCA